MSDYSHWSHWFPAGRSLTASQYDERAALLNLALERQRTWSRPAQMTTDTEPGHQFKAKLTALFDKWTSRRRIEARSGLRAALAADDQRTIARLDRAADVALLAQLDQGIAAARDRSARLARTRPIHRM